VRFAVAKLEGLSEDRAALIDDGYTDADEVSDAHKAVLAFTDVMLAGATPSAELVAELLTHFDDGQMVELGLGVALFHGFSKMLIVLGLEPEEMVTTVMPTPDVVRST
jgi:alkylhydroperoxidase family enzyme